MVLAVLPAAGFAVAVVRVDLEALTLFFAAERTAGFAAVFAAAGLDAVLVSVDRVMFFAADPGAAFTVDVDFFAIGFVDAVARLAAGFAAAAVDFLAGPDVPAFEVFVVVAIMLSREIVEQVILPACQGRGWTGSILLCSAASRSERVMPYLL